MIWIGRGALVFLVLLVTGSIAAVFSKAEWPVVIGPGDWAAVRFTLLQSVLSAGLSILVAIPLARALSRRRFWGRGFLISALGAPFILPVIVAVFGLLAIWGRSGLVSSLLVPLGFERVDIYGLARGGSGTCVFQSAFGHASDPAGLGQCAV